MDIGSSQDSIINSSSSSVDQGPVRVGLKADVTIVKVRKTAWLTLANALVDSASKHTTGNPITETGNPITETGIYKNDKNEAEITLFVQPNQGEKKYSKISESFNLL
jgi:hypothetical protein